MFNTFELKHAKYWKILAGLILVSILVASLIPIKKIEIMETPLSDKWLHFLTYSVATFYFLSVFQKWLQWGLILILFGIIIEFLQQLSGYRYLELLDMVANTIGVGIGVSLSFLSKRKFLVMIERALF